MYVRLGGVCMCGSVLLMGSDVCVVGGCGVCLSLSISLSVCVCVCSCVNVCVGACVCVSE